MRIFYYDSYDEKEVSAENSIEADYQSAARIFAGIEEAESYFGIHLSNEQVMQIYISPEDKMSLEILDTKTLMAETASVTTPIAETAIEAAYKSIEIKAALKQFFLNGR